MANESKRSGSETPPLSQIDKFAELARELGCDEDEAKFDEALKRIANTPPQHREKPKRDGDD